MRRSSSPSRSTRDHRVVDELRHQRDVPRQDADLAGSGPGEDERRGARPELALDGDDLDVHFSHVTPPFAAQYQFLRNAHHSLAPRLSAFFARSSRPPIRKNACSGRWSNSPLASLSNASMVSLSGTVEPG